MEKKMGTPSPSQVGASSTFLSLSFSLLGSGLWGEGSSLPRELRAHSQGPRKICSGHKATFLFPEGILHEVGFVG